MKPDSCAPDNIIGGCHIFEPHSIGINRQITELAGITRSPAPEFAVENKCAADTLSERHVKHIFASASGTCGIFTVSGGVGIIFDINFQFCNFFEFVQ